MKSDLIRKHFMEQVRAEMFKEYSKLKGRQIIFYGASGYGRFLLNEFKRMDLGEYVVSFCDSNPQKWGGRVGRDQCIEC